MSDQDFLQDAHSLNQSRGAEIPTSAALENLPTIQPETNSFQAEPDSFQPETNSFLQQEVRAFDMSFSAGLDEEDQDPGETRESFFALRDSISQGRELKAREKERDALSERIAADKDELADRENILSNFQAIANEQDTILATKNQERQNAANQLSDAAARIQETEQALERMRVYHSQQLQPLEANLGQAKAAADQAKNDERSRKSELNAIEGELRRAAEGDAEIATAQQRQVAAAYNEAKMRTESARDVLKQAERSYTSAKRQFESEEAPLKKDIDQLTEQSEELKKTIEQLDATIAQVRERRQYVDNVYQNPEDTNDLRQSLATDEATMRQMSLENDQLRAQLEETKDKARKAKLLVAGALVVIIAIIVVVLVLH